MPRLFVALELEEDARRRLYGWAGGVPAESLHVTLAFLGSRPEGDVARIAAAALDAARGLRAPVLAPAGVKRLRRLTAVTLDDPDRRCEMLVAAVAGALRDAGLFEPGERPFWPHVTVARGGHRPVGEPPAAPFACPAVALWRSHLGGGRSARYEALDRVTLASGR